MKKSFTGIARCRKTRRAVRFADRAAKAMITVGGLGTILSVLGVAIFLILVAMPLFLPSKVSELSGLERPGAGALEVGLDEYQVLAWMLAPSGQLEVFRLDNGEVRASHQLFAAGELVSASFGVEAERAVFGLADGSVQLARIVFRPEILDIDQLPAELAGELAAELESELESESLVDFRDGVLEKTPTGQYRFQRLVIEMGPRTPITSGSVLRLAHVRRPGGPLVVAVVEDHGGSLVVGGEEIDKETGEEIDKETGEEIGEEITGPAGQVALRLLALAFTEDTDFMTGETKLEIEEPVELPLDLEARGVPEFLSLTGSGSEVYAAWADGHLARLQIRDLQDPFLAESGRLPAMDSEARLRFWRPILGGTTFIWGDSQGRVGAGFPVRLADAPGELPGLEHVRRSPRATHAFSRTKDLVRAEAQAESMASSARSRLALAGFADGRVRLFNITNATQVASASIPAEEPVIALRMAPKEDGVLAVTAKRLYHADLDPRYPETGFSAFFRPVWYEGYAEPLHIWQSSSGTDDFEMKLGLMPLIFGTLKATLYSMLFGAPLALLAALFTSEFLSGRAKSVIKPSIELMASLPSVVLGFLAALVFAPFIEKIVPATLASFATLPLVFLLGAFLWQLLPSAQAIRFQAWRFGAIALMIPVGLWVASWCGPLVEDLLFGGDFKAWVAWNPGGDSADRFAGATGGFMLVTLPLSALVVALGIGRCIDPKMRDRSAIWDRRQFALADLVKFALAVFCTLGLSLLSAFILSSLGLDPRGGYVDTYIQRNAMIVGFVMGFAVIPIIYTISEDALSTVPEHLRSASLGAGATPWQTAVRIIIPTAMSGLFSAMMVGLGRAVGETMIVLMAAGNTPVMEWNIFEGFRTLSANIAVELPEAVQGSTHYRTLFLAALVLFVMTFLVNTVAEVIRQRFRKRAYQL